ncbi:MAG: endonuclease domain-containing protein [Polyangiaceae bacterium]|nr:endonuclease domain-containing protein [Polyangiaceae bacterium]
MKLAHARSMRADATLSEAVLWSVLRRRRLGGWKFRRQHVVAGYIVDFYCHEQRLALEVDGTVHGTQVIEDRRRDEVLVRQGVHVLRFRNAEMLERLDETLARIAVACESIRASRGHP